MGPAYEARPATTEQIQALTTNASPWASALPTAIDDAFPHSRADTRRALVVAGGVHRFGAGDGILQQGDESSVALFLDGDVAVRRTTADGRQFMVRIVTKGRLSPILPLTRRPASADAVALTRVRWLSGAVNGFGHSRRPIPASPSTSSTTFSTPTMR